MSTLWAQARQSIRELGPQGSLGHWERWGEESRGLKEKEEKNGGEQKEDGLGGRVLLLPMTPGLQGSTPCRPDSFLLWECYKT